MQQTHPDEPAATHQTVAFIGAGNMARAIVAGLIESGWPSAQIMASNPSGQKLEHLAAEFTIGVTKDNAEAARFADIIVLAVKPQKLLEVCRGLNHATLDLSRKLVISIAAGFPTTKISQALQGDVAIVRAMPNTPALVGCGATGLFANLKTSQSNRLTAESIFNAVGEVCWIDNEFHMDIVTAVAGSSPAYFFLMMQAMIEQAVTAGLAEKQAFALVIQAMAGAASLAKTSAPKSLATLREEVTSKGGTTAAAIASFTSNHFETIVKQAVVASIERGRELGNQE